MKTLPDYLRRGMRLVIVGINPGDRSARVGHYYAGRANPFWELLYESGVVPEPLEYSDDRRLIEFGIGLTDLVKRPTRSVEELRREEFAEGRVILAQKLEEFQPRVVAFHGKMAYERFAGVAARLGPQKARLYGARVFVLPSTSGANASLSRAAKLRYFRQLARLLERLRE